MTANKDKNTKSKLSFEAALEKLQETVKKLESGELSLDQSLAQFETGVRLSRLCQEHLSAAEQKVEILMKSPQGAGSESGAESQLTTQPFHSSN